MEPNPDQLRNQVSRSEKLRDLESQPGWAMYLADLDAAAIAAVSQAAGLIHDPSAFQKSAIQAIVYTAARKWAENVRIEGERAAQALTKMNDAVERKPSRSVQTLH